MFFLVIKKKRRVQKNLVNFHGVACQPPPQPFSTREMVTILGIQGGGITDRGALEALQEVADALRSAGLLGGRWRLDVGWRKGVMKVDPGPI